MARGKIRKITSEIKEYGIENYTLDLYIIPVHVIESSVIDGKSELKVLCLALEQILMLQFNPESNTLLVAGSPAGFIHKVDSRRDLKVATYVYDDKTKTLIFCADSRAELAKILGIGPPGLCAKLRTKTLYMGRYRIAAELLDVSEYSTDLISSEELSNLISQARAKGS